MQNSLRRGVFSSYHSRSLVAFLSGSLALLLLVLTLLRAFPAQAAAPFSVTMTSLNFEASFLLATSKNLSDPSHASFTLTNRSQLWYGLEVYGNPSSLQLIADDVFDGLKEADFIVLGLLPPSTFSDLVQKDPSHLDAAVKFTAPHQQLQVTLDPFARSAATLDVLGVILQYLGLLTPGLQIGLLKPKQIEAIMKAVEQSKELTELISDFVSAGHALPNKGDVAKKLLKVASDLYNIFATTTGRQTLTDILYLVVGNVISKTSLADVIKKYPLKAIVTTGQIAAFFLNYWFAFGNYLYRDKQLPTVFLQTMTNTSPTPLPQPTQPSGTIKEFMIPGGGPTGGITSGPDGNLWFTSGGGVGRITPTGQVALFTNATRSLNAGAITRGPDGNLWFTEFQVNKIGVSTPAGQISEYPIPTANSSPGGITAGPDGNFWFTELNTKPVQIGRITPGGSITEFQLPPSAAVPSAITAGPDGNLWFTDAQGIGRLTPSGAFTEFPTHSSQELLTDAGITTGPDGNLWFTEYDLTTDVSQIGRITPTGDITKFPLSTGFTQACGITTGPDSNLWFTEELGNKIGRITPNGQIKEYLIPTMSSRPCGITTGPDGNLWFTESSFPQVGRLTP
jgi:streptogramin lyase